MSIERKTILVVDDEPSNIALLSGLLKEQHKVKAAKNGEKALKICQSESPPDLVLLDVMMPDMDGYEVCRRLKAEAETQSIPVVFVSGNISEEEQQRGLELGANAYLGKPINADQLWNIIQHILN